MSQGVTRLSLPQGPAVTKAKIRQLGSRMLRVFKLSGTNYIELRNDETATGQSIAALFFASIGYAIGYSLFVQNLVQYYDFYGLLVSTLTGLIISMFAALIWALVTFFLGTKLFKGKANFWQATRPMFFSASPGILFILIGIPLDLVYRPAAAIVGLWLIIGGVVALKNSMGFGYERSMLIYIVGFLGFIALLGFPR